VTQTGNTFQVGGHPHGPRSLAPTLTGRARIVWILLILATLYLCYFHNLGAIGFVGPDEPRYVWVARDMAETGDWVTPRLYGKPWFEKPVLYYWGAAASFKLFGISEAAARLPSAIFALVATLSMAWLALRIFGAETARWLLLLLPTTAGMIGFSHAAATDMPFAGTLTIAMVFAAVIVGLTRNDKSPILPRTPWLGLLFFGFFLGLAVLAKGPAAIILSGGAVLLWATFTKCWRDAFRCLHPVAIASFCFTALPWYVLCARLNPDFFQVFIIEHNFKRFLTPEFQHVQPFWYYIPILLIGFLPWTLALLSTALLGCIRYWRYRRYSATSFFLLCWALFCLVFFSVSKSKLPGYILPAIPALGLFLAKSYVQLTSRQSRIFRWIQFGAGILSVAFGVALVSLAFGTATMNPGAAVGVGWVVVALGAANALLGIRRHRTLFSYQLSSLCVVPVFLLLGFLDSLSPHFMAVDPSGKTLASEIIAKQIPLDHIYVANMRRGQLYSLNFYLHQEMQEWHSASPKEGYLAINGKKCQQLVQLPFVCSEGPELNPSGWSIYEVTRIN
jgi:4-amino-4-deoxy-L-arabinose transferase-like glycosyltransferase